MQNSNGKIAQSIVIMGVTGSGKSTVGKMLADQLGWEFYDADHFHPEENVEKMSNGIPLTDNDRIPWLKALATLISSSTLQGQSLVLACSALKNNYRQLLREASETVTFVYLKGDQQLIGDRLNARKGHFMNPALLPTQFAALEEPSETEAVHIDIMPEPKLIVDSIVSHLTF
jgi:gluconokinase